MSEQNSANRAVNQKELEVVTKSTWWVPADWQIVDGRLRLPDGRMLNFWPELELENENRLGPKQFQKVEWIEASTLGLHFNTSYSALSVRQIKGRG